MRSLKYAIVFMSVILVLGMFSGSSTTTMSSTSSEDYIDSFVPSDGNPIIPVGNWSHGVTQDVQVHDDVAYVSNGCHLTIINVSSKVSPNFISTIWFSDIVYHSQIVGDLAFVAAGRSGLHVLDISTRASPVKIGHSATPTHAKAIAVIGDCAYVADYGFGLRIFNISIPTNPIEINTYFTGADSYRITASVDEVILVEGSEGLLRLDVSDPLSPSEVYRYDPGHVYACVIQGDYAYVGTSSSGFTILNLTITASPDIVSSSFTDRAVYNIAIEGNRSFLLNGLPNYRLVDITNKSGPVLLGEYHEHDASETISPWSGILIGDYSYLGCTRNGLLILHTQNPADIYESGRYTLPGGVYSLDAYEDRVYLAHSYDGLRIIDNSEPSNPSILGWLDNFGGCFSVDATEGYTYIGAGDHGIAVVDDSDPTNPVALGRSEREPYMFSVHAEYPYVYVASHYGGFFVIDVSNPSDPTTIYRNETLQYARDLHWSDGYVYFADDTGLAIFNVTEPTAVSPVGFYSGSYSVSGVFTQDKIAYIASGGLSVLNVSDPANPYEIGFWNTVSGVRDLWVDENLAFLACGSSGVYILDITDPTSPVEVGHIPAISSTEDVRYHNGMIMVADSQSSLWMYEHDFDQNGIYSIIDEDGTNPTIDTPDDITYTIDSSGHEIIWNPYDANPQYYQIYRDDTLLMDGDWNSSSETIQISVDELSIGEYTYKITVSDMKWANATDYVTVNVTESLIPVVNHPNDITYSFGASGYILTWHTFDDNPLGYTIYRNGTPIESGPWNSSNWDISINVSGYDIGSYIIMIELYDVDGHFVNDTVIVSVNQASVYPEVIFPDDITYTEGELGNNLTFILYHEDPNYWCKYIDGGYNYELVEWTQPNETVILNVDNLSVGVHQLVFSATGSEFFNTTGIVTITVLEQTGYPEIIFPEDITYTEGTDGNNLTFILYDENPVWWATELNGAFYTSGPWTELYLNVTVNVDGLAVGTHELFFAAWGTLNGTGSVYITVESSTPVEYTIIESFEIHSDAEFLNMATAMSWSGSGTYIDPFIISDYEIFGDGPCIWITNTSYHFEIRHCLIRDGTGSGILLDSVSMIDILDCRFENRERGIEIYNSVDCSITNCNFTSNWDTGVYFDNTIQSLISHSLFENNQDGIYASYSYMTAIDQCVFKEQYWHNIVLSNSNESVVVSSIFEGYGYLSIEYSYSCYVESCEFMNGGDYIRINQAPDINISFCNFEQGSWAIQIQSSPRANIQYNDFLYVSVGVFIDYSEASYIGFNTMYGVWGTGISATASYWLVIENNHVEVGTNGISLDTSDNTIIANNSIINYDFGLSLRYSYSCVVYNNVFELSGIMISGFLETCVIDESFNTINGKPLGYFVSEYDITINGHDYGQVILVNCTNVSIVDGNFDVCSCPIALLYCDSCLVKDVVYDRYRYGIYMEGTVNSMIQNFDCQSGQIGIFLENCINNTITECTLGGQWQWAIKAESSQEIYIINCTFYEDGSISLNYCTDFVISDCVFEFSGLDINGGSAEHWRHTVSNTYSNGKQIGYFFGQSNLVLDGNLYGQMFIVSCSNVTLTGGVFSEKPIGISLMYSSDCTITGCEVFYSSSYGIYVKNADNCVIENCLVYENQYVGLYLVNIVDCRISSNTGWSNSQAGILVQGAQWCIFEYNTAYENNYGMELQRISNCTFAWNTLYNNWDVGLIILWDSTSSTDNSLYGNAFANNGFVNAIDDSQGNFWDDGISQGNYWSDWSGDGSYIVPWGNGIDNYPGYFLSVDNPIDITIMEGTLDTFVTWTPEGAIGTSYEITLDDNIIESGIWLGGDISYPLDQLLSGYRYLTLTLSHDAGYLLESTVLVTVVDPTGMMIEGPMDIAFDYGETGYSIEWYVTAPSSFTYHILLDGMTIYESDLLYDNATIWVNLDYLEIGTYEYVIELYDEYNNMVSDTVIVSVLDPSVLFEHEPIYIEGDFEFWQQANEESWSGDGSSEFPYIIERFNITTIDWYGIYIRDVSYYFVIRNCQVTAGESWGDGINIEYCQHLEIDSCIVLNVEYSIRISDSSDVTITNCQIIRTSGFGDRGILFMGVSQGIISDNVVIGHSYAIQLSYCQNVDVYNNEIVASGAGMILSQIEYCNIYDNSLSTSGILLENYDQEIIWNSVLENNTIDGRPILFLYNEFGIDMDVSSYGQLIILDSQDIILFNFDLDCSFAIAIEYSTNVLVYNGQLTDRAAIMSRYSSGVIVENVTIGSYGSPAGGIWFLYCDSCIVRDTVVVTHHYGINYQETTNSYIIGCDVSGSTNIGIYVGGDNNYVINNTAHNNHEGIRVEYESSNMHIIGNLVTNNTQGIHLYVSYNTNIHGNIIVGNTYGIWIAFAEKVLIYDNIFAWNLISNAIDDGPYLNLWYNPLGIGNYWEDYGGEGVYEIPGGNGAYDPYPSSIELTFPGFVTHGTPSFHDDRNNFLINGTATWYAWTTNALYYELYVDEVLFTTDALASGRTTIDVDLTGITDGYHQFLMIVVTEGGNATDEIFTRVGPYQRVQFDGPLTVVIQEGSVGINITWTIYHAFPVEYSVAIDGIPLYTNPWVNPFETITVNLDGLSEGLHYVMISASTENSGSGESFLVYVVSGSPSIEGQEYVVIDTATPTNLLWNITTENPNLYILSLDGIGIDWAWCYDSIFSYVHEHSLMETGTYNYTFEAFDMYGYLSSYSTTVEVTGGGTAPIINSPDDFEMIEGTTGHIFVFSITGDTPRWYEVYRDGLILQSGTWEYSGQEFEVQIGLLELGEHVFTIYAYNEIGMDTAEVFVDVISEYIPLEVVGPSEITFYEGELGYEISWTLYGSDPDYFVVYLNGEQILMDNWTSGQVITISLDGLPAGNYYYDIVICDLLGSLFWTTTWVQVLWDYEMIIGPEYIYFEYGETNQSIIWELYHPNPLHYEVWSDWDTKIIWETWWDLNITVIVSLDDLEPGNYFFEIRAYGMDRVEYAYCHVQVAPIPTPIYPVVSEPEDVFMTEGDTGLNLTWILYDDYPYYYVVLLDNNVVIGEYSNDTVVTVTVSLDGLSVGVHVYSFEAFNTFGNDVFDWVTVTVEPQPGYITHDPISVYGDYELEQLVAAEGWAGDGSASNPYIIENLFIQDDEQCIDMWYIDSYITIRNCLFASSNSWGPTAIVLEAVSHARIENCRFEEVYEAVRAGISDYLVILNNTVSSSSSYNPSAFNIQNSEGVIIAENYIFNVGWGITLERCQYCIVTENIIQTTSFGVLISESDQCTMISNTMIGGGLFVGTYNPDVIYWKHNISDNILNDLPIGYFIDLDGYSANLNIDASLYSQLLMFNCTNVSASNGEYDNLYYAIILGSCYDCTISDMSLSNQSAILIRRSYDCRIERVSMSGTFSRISVHYSEEIIVRDSQFIDNDYGCITFSDTSFSIIFNCSFENTNYNDEARAISLSNCTGIHILDNLFVNNNQGINIYDSIDTLIQRNSFLNNTKHGLYIRESSSCIVTDNTFTGNYYGIFIERTDNCIVYSNYFADNSKANAYDYGPIPQNQWDDGVSVGNIWDDYSGIGWYYVPGHGFGIDHYPSQTHVPIAPITDSPQDMFFNEGDYQNPLMWSVSDDNPDYYEIWLDGYLLIQSDWLIGDPQITVDLNLTPGVYEYTLILFDEDGLSVSDTVIVTIIPDTTPPEIQYCWGTSYIHGESDNFIVWGIYDDNPLYYELYVDGMYIDTFAWIEQFVEVSYNVDGLDVGDHQFELIAYALGGNVSKNIGVYVLSDTIPFVSNPSDVSYSDGDVGNTITWTVEDPYLVYYLITIDGDFYEVNTLSSTYETIVVNIDGLDVGIYEFTITVSNLGFNATDTVFVTVNQVIPLEIIGPDEVTVLEGELGCEVSWELYGSNPNYFVVYFNDDLRLMDSWTSGQVVTINLDGLPAGTYLYRIVAYNQLLISVEHTVVVTVYSATPPSIGPRVDLIMLEGTSAATISWTIRDASVLIAYEIYLDGSLLISQPWNNAEISILVDVLPLGIYEYTLIAIGYGANATDIVNVYVVEEFAGTILIDYSHGQYYERIYVKCDIPLFNGLIALGYNIQFAYDGLTPTALEGVDALIFGSTYEGVVTYDEWLAVQTWFNSGDRFIWVGGDADYPTYEINSNSTYLLEAINSNLYSEWAAVEDSESNLNAVYRVVVNSTSIDPFVSEIVNGVSSIMMHAPTCVYGTMSGTPWIDFVRLEATSMEYVYPLLYYGESTYIHDLDEYPPLAYIDGEFGPFVAAALQIYAGATGGGRILVSGASPYGDYEPMCTQEYYDVEFDGLRFVLQAIDFAMRFNETLPTEPPTTSSPDDITFLEGDDSQILSWFVDDDNREHYEIWLNGELIAYEAWLIGDDRLDFELIDLLPEIYTYTLILFDLDGLNTTDSVVVTVNPDETPPEFYYYWGTWFHQGDLNNSIIWGIYDDNPSYYELYIDGMYIATYEWTEPFMEVNYNVDYLDVGEYQFELIAYGIGGNSSALVDVYVLPGTVPVVSSPLDITYSEFSSGNTISWTATDPYLEYYEILLDGLYYECELFDSTFEVVTINVDGLNVGVHEFTITVSNLGYNTTDIVIVTVLEGEIPEHVYSYLSDDEGTVLTYFDVVFRKVGDAYKLVTTRPSDMFYTIEFTNIWNYTLHDVSFNIVIPSDFVLKGTSPIQVFLDGVEISQFADINGTLIIIYNINSGSNVSIRIEVDYALKGTFYDEFDDFDIQGYWFEVTTSEIGANTLTSDSSRSSIFSNLKKVTSIAGYVTDILGNPLADVPVELYDYKGDRVASTITDDDGFYYFVDIWKGSYSVVIIYEDVEYEQDAVAEKDLMTLIFFVIENE